MCSVGIGMRSGKDKHPESIGQFIWNWVSLIILKNLAMMAKLFNVFPKSLQYLAHCLGKGGEENQITTAEICDR